MINVNIPAKKKYSARFEYPVPFETNIVSLTLVGCSLHTRQKKVT